MSFLKKQVAINYYNNLKDKRNKYLFQEDRDKAGSKSFYVCDVQKIFDKIEKTCEPHFYEFWTDESKLVFGVDIDFDIKKDKTPPNELLLKIISIVKNGAKSYYDYDYKTSNIIILENDPVCQKIDNPNKYSAHIIFRGLEFQNCVVAKDFFLRLNKDYQISKYYVDKSIYNMTCLRLFLNSKMGKNSILISKHLIINSESTKICNTNCSKKELYDFFLQTMLTYTVGSTKSVTTKDLKYSQEKLLPKCADCGNDISNVDVESILTNLPSSYYEDYDLWVKIGMILHNHSTESSNYFELWNKWSSQSSKYKEKEMLTKWNSFANNNNKLTIGSLIKWAKDEGVVSIFKNTKMSIEEIVNNYPITPIKLTTENFDPTNITKLDQAKFTPAIYTPVLNKKLIAVQSEKGTGKTSNLLETLFSNPNSPINENTSILFISSRVTFGFKLLGDLKDHEFELYSQIKDHQILSKRIICQIDSILRLERDKYDILIIDECESLARYLTSTHFTKNSKASLIVSALEMRLSEAKQIFIMDADLSDRCINYYIGATELKNMEDFHLIINEFKPYSEYQLTYCHYATWLRKILLMLEKDKKIVVAMASNSKAKDLDKKIKETYPNKKVLLIHKETSEEDKKNLLLKVNEEWIKYDVVIYTPSVCMGVSFDITFHFDYIFAYGCHESLGAQEWCQMIHRVRSPINKEIFIAIDKYKSFDKNEDTVDYNMVEKMLCSDYYLTNYDLHNNIVPIKMKRITSVSELDKGINEEEQSGENEIEKLKTIETVALNDKILYYPYKSEPIYDLYVRNSWELIENKLNFPACFFGYAKCKGYKLEFLPLSEEDNEILKEMKLIRGEREDEELDEKVNGIVNASDISKEDFLNKIKQKDEYITKEDMYSIYRYNLKNCYRIEQESQEFFTKDFVIEYFDKEKMKCYRNLSNILANENQTTIQKLQVMKNNQQYESIISNCYVDFSSKNKYTYHYYPMTIIEIIGFDINILTKTIKYPDLIIKINDAIKWCEDKKNEISFKYNIKSSASNLTTLNEVDKLKYINRILDSQYNLKIKRINNSVNKENILYRLDTNKIWDNLPDKIKYTETELEILENSLNLKRKIIPTNLQQKGSSENKNNFDTSNLDPFLEDD